MALLKQKYMYYLINGFNGMIIWRIHYFHTLGQCPRGAIYRRCTRRCSKTCDEPKKTGYCRDKCQPACICPGKRVLHNGKCIAPHTCPGAPSPSLWCFNTYYLFASIHIFHVFFLSARLNNFYFLFLCVFFHNNYNENRCLMNKWKFTKTIKILQVHCNLILIFFYLRHKLKVWFSLKRWKNVNNKQFS